MLVQVIGFACLVFAKWPELAAGHLFSLVPMRLSARGRKFLLVGLRAHRGVASCWPLHPSRSLLVMRPNPSLNADVPHAWAPPDAAGRRLACFVRRPTNVRRANPTLILVPTRGHGYRCCRARLASALTILSGHEFSRLRRPSFSWAIGAATIAFIGAIVISFLTGASTGPLGALFFFGPLGFAVGVVVSVVVPYHSAWRLTRRSTRTSRMRGCAPAAGRRLAKSLGHHAWKPPRSPTSAREIRTIS